MKRVFAFLYGLALGLLGWLRLFLSVCFGDRLPRWRRVNWFTFWANELGAVTVTFLYPIAGAGPPTAAQVALLSMVAATIIATADADTTAVITHNMNLSAAQLAAAQPIVVMTMLVSYAAAAYPAWTVTASGANSITCTKNTAVGSGNAAAQVQVTILRPNTIIQ